MSTRPKAPAVPKGAMPEIETTPRFTVAERLVHIFKDDPRAIHGTPAKEHES